MIGVFTAWAAKPEGLDVDGRLEEWQARSAELLAGPRGCWDLTGDVVLTASGYVPSTRWTRPGKQDHHFRGPLTARVVDGEWVSFEYELTAEEGSDKELEIPVWPLLGRRKPPEELDEHGERRKEAETETSVSAGTSGVSVSTQGAPAVNLLHGVLEEIDPKTGTAYAQWDERAGGVRLFEDFPLTEGRGADVVTVQTVIPEGGPLATTLDVTFPGRVRMGEGLVKATIFDGQGHVRGQVVDGTVLPALESLSLGLGALGFTIAYEQTIKYTGAKRCAP